MTKSKSQIIGELDLFCQALEMYQQGYTKQAAKILKEMGVELPPNF